MLSHKSKKNKASLVSPTVVNTTTNAEQMHQFKDNRLVSAEIAEFINLIQRQVALEGEVNQGKLVVRQPIEKLGTRGAPNNTGLPDVLKSGIENLSGYAMDDVRVHYNSSKPAQLNAHAYAQGTDIHLASGQEKHLPHEAWHVVQQKQGRVKPTMQMKGKLNINDDVGLEREADVMGAKALLNQNQAIDLNTITVIPSNSRSLQRKIIAGTPEKTFESYSEIESHLSPEQIMMIDSFPQIRLKMQSWLLFGENQFPYLTDVFRAAMNAAIPEDALSRQQAMDNHENKPYETDAFFEGDSLMNGISTVSKSGSDAYYAASGLNLWGVASGVKGMLSGGLDVAKGLVSKKTWMSAADGAHKEVRIVKAVALDNPELTAHYEQTKAAMTQKGISPNEKELYSGHSRFVMNLIKKSGHHPGKTPYNPSKGFGALGAGTYLTETIDKAIAYATGNKNSDTEYDSVLKYKVLLGNIQYVPDKSLRHDTNDDLVDPHFWPDEKRQEMYYEQSPMPRAQQSGFHSKVSQPDPNHKPGASALMAIWHRNSLDSQEFLVRNPTQILPVAEIFFTTE